MSQSQSELNDRVLIVVKYILNNSQSKIPFKKCDIIKYALNNESKIFPKIKRQIEDVLNEIYGFSFTEVPSKPGHYICYSNFEAGSVDAFQESEKKEMILLFIVVSYIFMKGGSVEEQTLMHFLKYLDISLDEIHPFFGNVKKIFEIFIKQLYLKREKCERIQNEETKLIYSWGFRSAVEISRKKLLKMVATNILQKQETDFAQQYEIAENAEYQINDPIIEPTPSQEAI